MKIKFLTVVFFCFSFSVFSQIENPKGFTPIQSQESSTNLDKPLINNQPKGLSNTQSFLNSKNKPKPLDVEEEKELNMTTDNGLMTRKFDFKPSWLTKDEEIKSEYAKGQLLGTFGTDSKTVEILCRDHQYVDGDRVKIIVNDQVIIHNINLREDFQSFIVDLKEGRNVIEFEALNQGTSGPNTAHFRVYDESSNLLTENVWNILTGVRAKLVVMRND
ncbi:MAG: hypothetical protein NXH73_01465 [Flavobacteriaceae bacterium]|nr:hypothetical protein [Flavobacteriaceae bacterium]